VARENRRWGRIWLLVVLILIVLVIAADRIGVVVADREIASQAKTQLASENVTVGGDPTVTIHGFPFLTQVAAGHYDKINIVVPNPSSKGISLSSLNVTATGVNADTGAVISGSGQIEADRVVGTGEINWSSFTQLVDLSGAQKYGIDPAKMRVSGTDDGHITLSVPVTLAGVSFTALATGLISVTNDVVHVKMTDVSTDDNALPGIITQQLKAIGQTLSFDARIPALPYNLKLGSVRATSHGISITASATHVVLGG
jgi:hypothetical protein